MEIVTYAVRDRLAVITLNRPEKRNALSPALIAGLRKAVEDAGEDEAVKVILLRAEGPAFCAGADLAYLAELADYTFEQNLDDSRHLAAMLRTLWLCPKPIVAAVQGPAIAGGTGLASVCDFVFAVEGTQFGYVENRIGFMPAIVSVFALAGYPSGQMQAKLLAGDIFLAEEAKALGIVYQTIKPEELEDKARAYCQELIKGCAAGSLTRTKTLMRELQSPNLVSQLEEACRLNAQLRQTEDFKNGIRRVLAKEKQVW